MKKELLDKGFELIESLKKANTNKNPTSKKVTQPTSNLKAIHREFLDSLKAKTRVNRQFNYDIKLDLNNKKTIPSREQSSQYNKSDIQSDKVFNVGDGVIEDQSNLLSGLDNTDSGIDSENSGNFLTVVDKKTPENKLDLASTIQIESIDYFVLMHDLKVWLIQLGFTTEKARKQWVYQFAGYKDKIKIILMMY